MWSPGPTWPGCPGAPPWLHRWWSSAFARRAFGDEAFAHLLNFFRQELEAFRRETVTDWELVRGFERM